MSEKPNSSGSEPQPMEPSLSDDELAMLSYKQIARLREIDALGKTGMLASRPVSELEELSREERQIINWFNTHLGRDNTPEKKLSGQIGLIGSYIVDESGDEDMREFFHDHIARPLREDPDTSGEPTPIEWEATRWLALEKFKRAAERGVVVHRKKEDASDLDGNVAVMLMRKAGIISDSTPLFYVEHDQLDGFMAKHPEIGIMMDISPERMEGMDEEQHRDSRASSLTPYGGRLYFDHHGKESSQKRPTSAARQVYNHLVNIGAIPTPIKTGIVYQRTQRMLDFVDAQDNKSYYGADFDLNKTARNAFGLMQLRRYDRNNTYHYISEINPATKTLGDDFVRLMELTGNDPTKILSDSELQSVGIKPDDIKTTEKLLQTALKKVEDLRREGAIIRTTYGSELLMDIDKSATKQLKGVDWTDVLYAAGVPTRVSYFSQPNGEYALFVASNDPRINVKEIKNRFGGMAIRNMYLWQPWREGHGAPRPALLADELDIINPDERGKIVRLEKDYPHVAYGETYRQRNEKSCAIACLVNLAIHAFGEKNAKNIENWLIDRATADGLFHDNSGMKVGGLLQLARKLEYKVSQSTDITEIQRELENGKGAIIFRNDHAVTVYLSKNPATSNMELVYRDPIGRPTKDQPDQLVMIYNPENLAKFIGPNPKSKQNPYGHVIIIGKRGLESDSDRGVTTEQTWTAKEVTERELAENQTLTFEERLSRIMNTYRPRLEIANAPDFDANRRSYNDAVISPIYNPFLWPRSLARMITNKSFWRVNRGYGGRTDWQKTDKEVLGFIQSLADSRLEQAYHDQANWLRERTSAGIREGSLGSREFQKWKLGGKSARAKKNDQGEFVTEKKITPLLGLEQESYVLEEDEKAVWSETLVTTKQEALAWYESRLISEAIVFAEQDDLIRKSEAEYANQLQANILELTQQKGQHTYTRREKKSLEARIKYLTDLKSTITSKPLAEAKIVISELRVRFYSLQPEALATDVSLEMGLASKRKTEMESWVNALKIEAENNDDDGTITQTVQEMLFQIDQYQKLIDQLIAIDSAETTRVREFVELQDEQSRQYHKIIWQLATAQSLLTSAHSEKLMGEWVNQGPLADGSDFDPDNINHLEWLQTTYEPLSPMEKVLFLLALHTAHQFRRLNRGDDSIELGEPLDNYVIRRLREISEDNAGQAAA